MRVTSITVNTLGCENEHDAIPGETREQIIERMERTYPDWTSMVLVMVRSTER